MHQNNGIDPSAQNGALSGIKVIDLSRVLGGPYCAQILGDHGADVIKVEPPTGDETRGWGPPFLGETASYFLGANRNKRSIVVDLKLEAGRDLILALLSDADVLIENFKPGTLEAWGMDRETLQSKFPRLVHCRITGFGSDGPLGGLPGYDACVQAMSGLMSVNGVEDGEPTRIGVPAVDIVTGLYATIAIGFALFERSRSGRGQFVETTLYDCAISLQHPHAANYLLSGAIPVRTGNAHPNIAPYETIATSDGNIFLAIGNNRQFAKLATMIGAGHIASDPRFSSNALRLSNRLELRDALSSHISHHKAFELADLLMRSGVPAAATANVGQALSHPHTYHRKMIVEKDGYKGIGTPIKMQRSASTVRHAPPKMGEHRDEILSQHGLDVSDPSVIAATSPKS